MNVEWLQFQIYFDEYVIIQDAEKDEILACDNGDCGIECRCGCERHCQGECGSGCYPNGYRYEPTTAQMVPPIPLMAMIHYLHNPEDLGGSVKNRGFLPKRTYELAKSNSTDPVQIWGLHFHEKVWQAPIDAVKGLSIIGALLVSFLWIYVAEEKTHVNNLFPRTLVSGIFQALASWMNEWAERPLANKAQEQLMYAWACVRTNLSCRL